MASGDQSKRGASVLRPPLWAVGGGKGGVGKSLTSLNLATYLALMGRKVVIIDGDLGGADVHTLMGMPPPERSLASFLDREVDTLDEALVPTPVANLSLLAGASDILGLANPQYGKKERLLRHLNKLSADELILDLGAGTSYATLDMWNLARRRLAVLTPDPTSIQDTYAFLKTALHREIRRKLCRKSAPDQELRDALLDGLEGRSGTRANSIKELRQRVETMAPGSLPTLDELLDGFRPWLVLNMASRQEGANTAAALAHVASEYLSAKLRHAATIERDQDFAQSVRAMRPFLMDHRGGARWRDFATLAGAVLREDAEGSRAQDIGPVEPPPMPPPPPPSD